MDKDLVLSSVKALEKRGNSNNEELHKILANLDGVNVQQDQTGNIIPLLC